MAEHVHEWVKLNTSAFQSPFRCTVKGCTALTHPRICADDEGKIECSCGLDDMLEAGNVEW